MSEIMNQDFLVCHQHYQHTMDSVVLPQLDHVRQMVTVSGADGKPLSCHIYPAEASRGTVVIVHGFTENAYKYSELIWSLLQNHYSVVAYDQRGHGFSWRSEHLADLSLTHVDSFSEYVQDLKAVCDTCLAGMPGPWMVFAHSMGGAVTSLFLERWPEVFSRAVLCAPMIAPNLSGVPAFAVSAICHTAKLFGSGKGRLFLSKPYTGPEDFATSCATDPGRFAWYDAVKASHPEYHNSSPTYSWVLESVHVTRMILAPGAPEKISCPVLLFTADQDFSVLPGPQKDFIKRVPSGKHVFVSSSRHEIYRSTDEVLFPWWHSILEFFGEEGARA